MIKRLTMWHTLDGVSTQEALVRWRTDHAELVRQVPGIRRYVQHHCVPSPEKRSIPYTGLGEVWFDDFDAATRATSSPEWGAVLADAATFMDLEHVVAAWAEEQEIIPLQN